MTPARDMVMVVAGVGCAPSQSAHVKGLLGEREKCSMLDRLNSRKYMSDSKQ